MKPQFVMVGRKRKTGQRYPGGQLQPDRGIDPKVIAFAMPHRRGVAEDLRHDPKAESQLGRYQLNGKITKWEYDAGRWYAGTVNRYRALIEAPNASPPSTAGVLIPVFGGRPTPVDDDEAERRTTTYNLAYECLNNIGQKAAKAVARVAVYDERCPEGLWAMMRLGLLALAVHRGLVTEDKILDIRAQIVHSRNRS